MPQTRRQLATSLVALVLIVLSVLRLEQHRVGLVILSFAVADTPVTLYQRPGSTAPVVVVAHGFAGSRQIMQAYALPLAQAGYRVLAFDFEGHGRNPTPMSGDVTSIDGTTALLVAETRRVIAAARALPDARQIAVLGHSMATDIVIRASDAESRNGSPVDAVIAISMFSQAVTATTPRHLLIISGQSERFLRRSGLEALSLVDPTAAEGDLATNGPVTRRSVVAPWVGHVGVLFSPTAVQAAQDWLDTTLGHPSAGVADQQRGWWILALLAGLVLGFHPLVMRLPKGPAAPPVSTRRFLVAALLPAAATPLLVTPIYQNVLPVLVADYLVLHLALFGVLQLIVLRPQSLAPDRQMLRAAAVLTFWGLCIFGLALDRYAANFWPTPQRLPIIAALCLGTLPAMVADSFATEGGRAPLWRRGVARAALFASMGGAAALDPTNLTFVLIVLPVCVLFYGVHGMMGRWIGRQSGALAAGVGLGLCLAWALGVSFPMFAHG